MPAIAFRLIRAIAEILMPKILIQWRGENPRYRQNP